LVPIPGIGLQDIALIPSILRNAGFHYRIHNGYSRLFAEELLLIRKIDVPAIKELLADYRLRDEQGNLYPIPWE
jgi:hypothetical protein